MCWFWHGPFTTISFVCRLDRRLYIMNVVARDPGSTNDSYIFEGSAVRTRMQVLYARRRCHLLGDSGYALEPWMITPFARGDRPEEGTPEDRFNKVHSCDRNCVERCVGLLKGRFRCVNDERVLYYDYVKVCKIILAVCVLHNLVILGNVPHYVDEDELQNGNVNENEPEEIEGEVDLNDPDVPVAARHVAAVLAQGRVVRQEIMQQLEEARQRR